MNPLSPLFFPLLFRQFNYPAFFVHAEELLAAGSLSDVYIFTSKLYSDRFGKMDDLTLEFLVLCISVFLLN